jgi:hypothetical protein
MQHLISTHTGGRTHNRRQACILLLLGLIFLAVARLGMFNSYAVGVLLFGLGMLGAASLNPRRFLPAGWLTTMLGVATFLMFRQYIPNSQIMSTHILAIGLGLLGIAWMTHRGFIGTGALTPGIFVVGIGVVEFLQAAHLTPTALVPFVLSLWLPGSGFFALGLFSLVTNRRTETQSIN